LHVCLHDLQSNETINQFLFLFFTIDSDTFYPFNTGNTNSNTIAAAVNSFTDNIAFVSSSEPLTTEETTDHNNYSINTNLIGIDISGLIKSKIFLIAQLLVLYTLLC